MFQKILVALDSSESSQHVFEKALDLAKTNQAELMLLHVLSPTDEAYPMPIYPSFDGIYPIQHDELMRSAMQQFSIVEQAGYDKLRSHSLKAEVENVLTHMTQSTGDPGELICSTAKQWSADLIVIGRRGRSALTELLLGSVSNHVMHHASCSVLVVQAALVSA
ncbi:MAG: universal stress protein [Myxacorys chilensis ATA2-1-KO14]|jgi:nucleotide-binding universal stress UspA family protein|nr:universal stress protein [Myxacorys chilensis ATA2-1-KO14]